MTYERNVGMKVFSKLYVGYKNQVLSQDGYDHKKCEPINPVYGVPLGFATPYEDNAAGRKRQGTVDGWTKGWGKVGPDIQPKIIDNELVAGFKITDDIKRTYYGGGNVVFRVEDPRGFELEIQSQNLMTLISLVGLEAGGVIPGKCCWGRDGANNILIHESSEEYKSARMAAETIKPLPGIKADFKRGDKITLTNGETVRYLGRFWFTGYESVTSYDPPRLSDQPDDTGPQPSVPPIHYVSKHFDQRACPGGKMPVSRTADRFTEPKQFHVIQTGVLATDHVIIYRELKAVTIDKPIDVEITVEEALRIINTRNAIRPASQGGPYVRWVRAAVDKRPLTWKKFPLTQKELDDIKFRMNDRTSYAHIRKSMHDYINSYESNGMQQSYLVEHNGELWHPASEHHDKQYVLNADLQFGNRVSIDDPRFMVLDTIYINGRYHYSMSSRIVDVSDVTGEPRELFIFEAPKTPVDTLQLWFDAGMLFTIKPVYAE